MYHSIPFPLLHTLLFPRLPLPRHRGSCYSYLLEDGCSLSLVLASLTTTLNCQSNPWSLQLLTSLNKAEIHAAMLTKVSCKFNVWVCARDPCNKVGYSVQNRQVAYLRWLVHILTCGFMQNTLTSLRWYWPCRLDWLGDQFEGRTQNLFFSFWICCFVGAALYISAYFHLMFRRWYTSLIVSFNSSQQESIVLIYSCQVLSSKL